MRKLTPETRALLKKPLGKLVGSEEAANAAKETHAGGRLVVSIGDSCSWELMQRGGGPDIVVYDDLCKRQPTGDKMKAALSGYDGEPVVVKNPAGFISDELETALLDAFREGHGKIRVVGEEDLAALPAIMEAPNGTLVFYGQPDEGVVLVEVNEEKKRNAREIFSRMEAV